MREHKNVWKYSTVGLLAVLAIGFSFPQAFAHITTNTAHMLQHIYNMADTIKENVRDIKSDVADIKATTDALGRKRYDRV